MQWFIVSFISGFSLTFQKRFVSFPNENYGKADITHHGWMTKKIFRSISYKMALSDICFTFSSVRAMAQPLHTWLTHWLFSESNPFIHLVSMCFGVNNFRTTCAMKLIFFLKYSKFNVDSKNTIKIWQIISHFLDNCHLNW